MEAFKKLVFFVMDTLEAIIFIGSIFIVVYLFVMSPHQVKGASMEPTFTTSDYILTSKIAYRLGPPKRGDIIVFKSPKNAEIDFIKRIIGLPGDQISIKNDQVYRNGQAIDEPYLGSQTGVFDGGFIKEGVEVTVPQDYLFIMGDNRARSLDSREFGFISAQSVIGKVFFRYFPPHKVGRVSLTPHLRAFV